MVKKLICDNCISPFTYIIFAQTNKPDVNLPTKRPSTSQATQLLHLIYKRLSLCIYLNALPGKYFENRRGDTQKIRSGAKVSGSLLLQKVLISISWFPKISGVSKHQIHVYLCKYNYHILISIQSHFNFYFNVFPIMYVLMGKVKNCNLWFPIPSPWVASVRVKWVDSVC